MDARFRIPQEWVHDISLFKKYQCPHCQHLLHEAVQPPCGHWLCEGCAKELMTDSTAKCPQPDCQEDLHSQGEEPCFPDRFVRKEISKMIISCPNRENGCQWENKVGSLKGHMKACVFASQRCPMADFGCEHKQQVTKEELKHHVSEFGVQHLQLFAGVLSLLRPLLPASSSSGCAGLVERDCIASNKTRTEDQGYYSLEKPKHARAHEATTAITGALEKLELKLSTQFTAQIKSKDDQIGALKQKVDTLEKGMKSKHLEYEDRDFRLSLIENGTFDGTLIWKIPQFSQRMADAQSGKYTSIFSLPFHSGRYGYKMCLRLYILGDGIGKNTHMSLFFAVMKGEFDGILQWPFTHKVTFKLINQTGGMDIVDTFKPDPMSSSFRKPKSDMNIASGCPRFVSHTELNSGGFRVDDTVFIKCTVECSDVTN